MEIKFLVGIKSVNTKQLVHGDHATRIMLEKDSMDTETLSLINCLIGSDLNKSQELVITIGTK